jgi:hypothetical protein
MSAGLSSRLGKVGAKAAEFRARLDEGTRAEDDAGDADGAGTGGARGADGAAKAAGSMSAASKERG